MRKFTVAALILKSSQESLPVPLKNMIQSLKFQSSFYLELNGTDMGSPFAPDYVNIFMDSIEQCILQLEPENNKPFYDFASLTIFFLFGILVKIASVDILLTWTPYIQWTNMRCPNQCIVYYFETLESLKNDSDFQRMLYMKPAAMLLQAYPFNTSSCKKGIIYK